MTGTFVVAGCYILIALISLPQVNPLATVLLGRTGPIGKNTPLSKLKGYAFTEAIRLKPDFAEAYFDRCRAYDRLNLPSVVSHRFEDCDKAVQLKPGFAQAYHYRGRAYAAHTSSVHVDKLPLQP